MRTYSGKITVLPDNGIFVFGSNTQGRHGKGSALIAKNNFGAVYGKSTGRQGQSYAIITKDLTKKTHPSVDKSEIQLQVDRLYQYAIHHPDLDFYVAYSCGQPNLNAYDPVEMADMFRRYKIPENIVFEEGFFKLICELDTIYGYKLK